MKPWTWRDDGESPFERDRVLNPPPSDRALRSLANAIRKRVPVLEAIPLVESWAGMIDMTPDVVPVLDEVDDRPGLFIASGFSGHGFGIGPGAGRVMASLVLGESPGHDLTRFPVLPLPRRHAATRRAWHVGLERAGKPLLIGLSAFSPPRVAKCRTLIPSCRIRIQRRSGRTSRSCFAVSFNPAACRDSRRIRRNSTPFSPWRPVA